MYYKKESRFIKRKKLTKSELYKLNILLDKKLLKIDKELKVNLLRKRELILRRF